MLETPKALRTDKIKVKKNFFSENRKDVYNGQSAGNQNNLNYE